MMLYGLIALQVFDLLTTLYLLKRGGSELNPILSKLQGLLGRDGAIVAAKAALIGALLYFPIPDWALIASTALYVVVVLHNLRQIKSS